MSTRMIITVDAECSQADLEGKLRVSSNTGEAIAEGTSEFFIALTSGFADGSVETQFQLTAGTPAVPGDSASGVFTFSGSGTKATAGDIVYVSDPTNTGGTPEFTFTCTNTTSEVEPGNGFFLGGQTGQGGAQTGIQQAANLATAMNTLEAFAAYYTAEADVHTVIVTTNNPGAFGNMLILSCEAIGIEVTTQMTGGTDTVPAVDPTYTTYNFSY